MEGTFRLHIKHTLLLAVFSIFRIFLSALYLTAGMQFLSCLICVWEKPMTQQTMQSWLQQPCYTDNPRIQPDNFVSGIHGEKKKSNSEINFIFENTWGKCDAIGQHTPWRFCGDSVRMTDLLTVMPLPVSTFSCTLFLNAPTFTTIVFC